MEFLEVALVGVGLRLPQSDFAKSLSWAYFPRPEVIFYRCTVISNFSPLLVPDSSKFWSVLCEIGLKKDEKGDPDFLIEKTIEGLLETKIVNSNDQVYSTWHTVLDHGYPIPSIERESEIKKINEVLETRGIFSRGRFGGWKYEFSNQDCSFEIGRQVVGEIFLQEKESIFQLD
ncbi:hypothetical protein FO519_009406 [Halicephalobus sp. NKZ332]|nr:hypothetical protein FO519_009406 [Halicephalobus sp. NKZ332]